MKNLAGDLNADGDVARELVAAGITVVSATGQPGEVPTVLAGKLGPFTFTRCWTYWRVAGPVPLAVAEQMYAHPTGRTDVRVAGHVGCEPPRPPWVDMFWTSDGKPYPVVSNYDIDSAAGLRLFADAVRAAGVVDNPPVLTALRPEEQIR